MFEEIEQNIFINRNFSFLVKKSEFKLFLKFITEDFSIAQKYLENLDKGEMPISKLPSYMQEYFALKNYSKKEIKLFKHFVLELEADLMYNPLNELQEGKNIRVDLFNLYEKYESLITPKVLVKKIDAELSDNFINCLNENYSFNSSKLAKHFVRYAENNKVSLWLYAITIGSQIDAEIKRLNNEGDVYSAYVLHAIGAGFVDITAEDLNKYLNSLNGKQLKRFSPGFEDWDISELCKIFSILKYPYEIGVSLTESFMILPETSTSGMMA